MIWFVVFQSIFIIPQRLPVPISSHCPFPLFPWWASQLRTYFLFPQMELDDMYNYSVAPSTWRVFKACPHWSRCPRCLAFLFHQIPVSGTETPDFCPSILYYPYLANTAHYVPLRPKSIPQTFQEATLLFPDAILHVSFIVTKGCVTLSRGYMVNFYVHYVYFQIIH